MARTYTYRQFILHLIRAKRWDAFHSPYLFRLFTTCCDESIPVNGAEVLEKQRTAWLASTDVIQRNDLGAGSKAGQQAHTSISGIAGNSLSKPFQCRFLSRLIQLKRPATVLELGTSLGISAAYMAFASKDVFIHTVEGDPEIATRAGKLFNQNELENIALHIMPFDEFLHRKELTPNSIDVLFMDGHHTSSALTAYFNALHHCLHEESIVIVDDIYWSPDMQHGWKTLRGTAEVTQSVDCFHFGLLFFGKNLKQKEHHMARLPLSMLFKSK